MITEAAKTRLTQAVVIVSVIFILVLGIQSGSRGPFLFLIGYLFAVVVTRLGPLGCVVLGMALSFPFL